MVNVATQLLSGTSADEALSILVAHMHRASGAGGAAFNTTDEETDQGRPPAALTGLGSVLIVTTSRKLSPERVPEDTTSGKLCRSGGGCWAGPPGAGDG
jgi:hypothetical protein